MAKARIIDGKDFAARLRARIGIAAAKVHDAHGITAGLAAVLVGEDPASEIYVRNKGRAMEAAGMASITHRLAAESSESDLLGLVAKLNADPDVNGILVQLPLPGHMDTDRVIAATNPAKDVDGFHLENVGRLATGMGGGMVPCTPQGCLMLLKDALGDLAGLDAVVLGRSNIVGKPMAHLLLAENCTVTIAHSRTRDLAEVTRRADILIAAVGRAQMVGAEMIKPGAAVIDVGINRIDAGGGKARLVGDVEFEAALEVAGHITPVPGGVGPMTIACLLGNTLRAACAQAGVETPEF
jgi:methylenetetrahydrofolate dehydrogenase (NADP+)/methenyltetrahydrofolate cyclohydrolase